MKRLEWLKSELAKIDLFLNDPETKESVRLAARVLHKEFTFAIRAIEEQQRSGGVRSPVRGEGDDPQELPTRTLGDDLSEV